MRKAGVGLARIKVPGVRKHGRTWFLLLDCQPGPHMVCCPPRISEGSVTTALELLLEAAKKASPSPEQQEEQRRSFAYGNTHFENPRITRAMIDEEAEAIARERDRRRE
jgi:hypothetical protein